MPAAGGTPGHRRWRRAPAHVSGGPTGTATTIALGLRRAYRPHRSPHRRPRRQPVVDEHHGSPAERRHRSIAPEASLLLGKLAECHRGAPVEVVVAYAQLADHVVVEDHESARGDGADRQLDVGGAPILRTVITSSGPPSRAAIGAATGTPPRGSPSTTGAGPIPVRPPSSSASTRPASARSRIAPGAPTCPSDHLRALDASGRYRLGPNDLASRPLIGLSGRRKLGAQIAGLPPAWPTSTSTCTSAPTPTAITAAGGLPVHLPQHVDPADYAGRLDGLLLSGGDRRPAQPVRRRPATPSCTLPNRDAIASSSA